MSQVTIYLDEEVEQKMTVAAHSANLSKSKWIAQLIQDKVANEWPQSIVESAGSWDDFPELDQLRENFDEDAEREQI